jgi:hypothetical protein
MRYAIYLKKIFESCKFTSMIGIEGDDFMLEIIFNNGFKVYECRLDIRFAFKSIEPCITCKMIHKNNIIFKVINGVHRSNLYIRENYFKRSMKL